MATKKDERPKRSGFDAPVYGTVHPKGSTIKRNKDGTVTIVHPADKKNK